MDENKTEKKLLAAMPDITTRDCWYPRLLVTFRKKIIE